MSVESKKKELQDELQTFTDKRIRQREKTIAGINDEKDREITKTNVKLQKNLKAVDDEISSLHKKPEPKFKFIGQQLFRRKQSRGRKPRSKFKWIKLLFKWIGILVYIPFWGIVNLICFVIYLIKQAVVKRYNSNIECKIRTLREEKARISNAAKAKNKEQEKTAAEKSEDARVKAERDIKQKEKKIKENFCEIKENYKKDVAASAKKFQNNLIQIDTMVERISNVFERLNSTFKSTYTSEPLIELNLKFEVSKKQLIFFYEQETPAAGMENIKENTSLTFALEKDSECEGLAIALAQISKKRIEEKYYPTMILSFKQENASVTISTKDINPSPDAYLL